MCGQGQENLGRVCESCLGCSLIVQYLGNIWVWKINGDDDDDCYGISCLIWNIQSQKVDINYLHKVEKVSIKEEILNQNSLWKTT